MSTRPTRTTNPLPFIDLEPSRFEDLCLNLLYPMHPWKEIRHYGRGGGDGGIDIHAIEELEDGAHRNWFVQCRRYSKASKATLKTAVNDALAQCENVPDVLLVVVACNPTRKAQEGYQDHALSRGVETAMLWRASELEAKLYAERKDLLFTYFGVSMASESREREAMIRRNLALKRRMYRELRSSRAPAQGQLDRPWTRFDFKKVIVHSIDDEGYPERNDAVGGVYLWRGCEPFDFYHNGIELITGIEHGMNLGEDRWCLVPPAKNPPNNRIKMYRTECLPYRNIVDFDTIGDDYYGCPHFYCRYAEGGTPFETIQYRLISEGRYPLVLPVTQMVEYPEEQ